MNFVTGLRLTGMTTPWVLEDINSHKMSCEQARFAF
jgi:hypothetical protein